MTAIAWAILLSTWAVLMSWYELSGKSMSEDESRTSATVTSLLLAMTVISTFVEWGRK